MQGIRPLTQGARPRSYNLLVPESVRNTAKNNTQLAKANFTSYFHTSHTLYTTLRRLGVNPRSDRVQGHDRPYLLPPLNVPHEAIDPITRFTMTLRPSVITESEELRQRRDLSLGEYAERALRLLNYMFEIKTGNPIQIQQSEITHYLILADIDIPHE